MTSSKKTPNSKKKSSSKKQSQRRAAGNNKKSARKQSNLLSVIVWRTFIFLFLVAIILVTLYVLYLDRQVVSKFSGKKWSVPAHVYARPLELYEGIQIDPAHIVKEAKSLGYVEGVNKKGSIKLKGNKLYVYTRGFKFIDGIEKPKNLKIVFRGKTIRSITNSAAESEPLVRLEPLIIGGIYPESNEGRMLVKYEDIPESMIKTLLAVEDRAFFEHYGISIRGILRALFKNISSKKLQQGGSTLTQQLVKNFYLTSERSLKRKINEAIMSILLELHYSKEEILETYANEIYLGQNREKGVHGFGLASFYYFNKPIDSLDLHEYALLVGIVKGPSAYDPNRRPKSALKRRNQVLEVLREQGLFGEEAINAAKEKPLMLGEKKAGLGRVYPAYLDLVRRQLKRDYKDSDLKNNGLNIHTNFDPQVQWEAERALASKIKRMEQRIRKTERDELQASTVVVNTETGEVLALIGDKKSQYAGFNRALDAKRPIGSLIKPAVYLAALMQPENFTLASVLKDEKVSMIAGGKRWEPKNFDKKEHGDIMFYRSLALSYNLSTVKLGLDVGLNKVIDVLDKLGIAGEIPKVPSLLLGALDRSPYDVATMYQTIAANGFYGSLRAIRDVEANDGKVLNRYPLKVEKRIDSDAMYLLHFAMHEVVRGGTAKSVYSKISSKIELAGKTGTSNDQRDSWFAGFSGNRLAVVWVGRDDNKSMPFSGGTGALPIWTDIMSRIQPRSLDLQEPEGVESFWIDSSNGRGTQEDCENAIVLPFIKDSQPEAQDNCGVDWSVDDLDQEALDLEDLRLNDSRQKKRPRKKALDWVSDMIQ